MLRKEGGDDIEQLFVCEPAEYSPRGRGNVYNNDNSRYLKDTITLQGITHSIYPAAEIMIK